jgi:hypothetical protein
MSQIISDIAGLSLSGASDTMARNLMARLNAAYPAFAGCWRITVNEVGGVIEVVNMAISEKYGFLMHIDKVDAEGRKVVMYAGELLERFRIARDAYHAAASMADAKRDFRGEMVVDHG